MSTTVYPAKNIEQKPKSALRQFYEKHEKYTGLTIFAIGFLWDSLTMTRVDNIVDNVILLFYLAIIGAMIILTLRRQCGKAPAGWVQRFEPRLLWAMQFCFGGLFSSYVIFYFKSASFTRTQFFLLICVFLWIGNEFLEQRLKNQVLLAVLYCFCLFSFFAFFLPVLLAKVNMWIFLLAGFLSLLISLGVFAVGLLPDRVGWRRRMVRSGTCIFSTFLVVNVLYFGNLIPPVPLAIKSAGIYHQVTRNQDGFSVSYVAPPLSRFWRKWDDPFYYSTGERVYCYTAVFAPSGLRDIPVYHVWSRKSSRGWIRTDHIGFDIVKGGREGGFRGYTYKSGVGPGEWRVEVETQSGQTLGRINFTVVTSPALHPPLVTKLLQ